MKPTSGLPEPSTETNQGFSFFGVPLVVRSADPAVLQKLVGVYERFAIDRLPEGAAVCHVRGSVASDDLCLQVADRHYPLRGPNGFDWLEMVLFHEIMKRLDSHVLLHAGVVSREGRATIIYAPSGFGKTTLTLELVSRGYSFLSDEFCPIAVEGHTIAPFPRRVGLTPESPFFVRVPDGRGFYLHHEGKCFVDCDDLYPGTVTRHAATVSRLIVLTDDFLSDTPSVPSGNCYEVLLYEDSTAVRSDIENIPGARIEDTRVRDGYVVWRVRLPQDSAGVADFQVLWQRHEREIFCVGRKTGGRPDFTTPPAARPMAASEAARELLVQLLNRSHECRVMKRFQGRTLPLLMFLSGVLSRAKCYRVKPGGVGDTADLIESL